MVTAAETLASTLEENLNQVIFGLDEVIEQLCVALIAKGHVLLEGYPGLGKTLLAKHLAYSLGGNFKRIQCTSDLMPSDITGLHVFNPENHSFEWVPGPLFCDVLLVDEINRTGPKTQSALLQAMEEGFVSVDKNDYPLPENFLVLASQNPHEFEGIYPLPESQLDRFLMKVDIHYPKQEAELKILHAYDKPGGGHSVEFRGAVIEQQQIEQARKQALEITISEAVYQYTLEITQVSRQHSDVSLGLSTRGVLALLRCARALAAIRGSDFVTPDDIKAVAKPTIAHRLILKPGAHLEGVTNSSVCDDILQQVNVPRD